MLSNYALKSHSKAHNKTAVSSEVLSISSPVNLINDIRLIPFNNIQKFDSNA